MELFIAYFEKIYEFFQLEMNVYGFVFSFWDVFKFSLVSALIVEFFFVFVPDL